MLNIHVAYNVGSQSAPYGVPELLYRNLKAPQAIRLPFCFYFRNLLLGYVNKSQPLQELHNTKSFRTFGAITSMQL